MQEANSSRVEARLNELGFTLPAVAKPVAAYLPAITTGNYVFTSGQLPVINGELTVLGKVGAEVSAEEAAGQAQICALNALAAIKAEIGNLDRIKRIVKVVGFVASDPAFTGQPAVINGASEFFGEVLADAGLHARSAVGVASLPLNAAVEVEVIAEFE